jgi:hypothetical protein
MLTALHDSRKPLVGLENSQFYSQISGFKGIQTALNNSYFRDSQMRFVLLDSFNFLEPGDLEKPISSHDLRYKSLFLLAKVTDGPLVGIIHHLHMLPVSHLTDKMPVSIFLLPLDDEKPILHWSSLAALKSDSIPSNLTDIFPLRFLHASHYRMGGNPNFEIQRNGKGKYVHNIRTVSDNPSPIQYAIDSCQFERLEIYEMQRRYLPETLKLSHKRFHPASNSFDFSEITDQHPTKRARTAEKNETFPLLTKYSEMIDSSAKQFEMQMKQVEAELSEQKTEIEFMKKYFYKQWFVEKGNRNESRTTVLKKIMEKKIDSSAPSSIISFNVEGHQLPILRSTILRLIPDSLLGIKVSGRWTIQPNEMDEQGNLIVNNCSKEAFDQIITALQFYDHGPTGTVRMLLLTEKTKDEMAMALDYLQIQFFTALCLRN